MTSNEPNDGVVEFRRSTGPTSDSSRWTYFDINGQPATEIVVDGASTGSFLQALVNHTDDDGYCLISVRYPPGAVVPRHRHDVAQIVLVLEGEIRQGNRRIPAGAGYYSPPRAPYRLEVGDEGARVLEFRHNPMTFTTEWLDGSDAARRVL
jgi:hypothetical protein